MSARLKLTLSYAAFLMLAGVLLLAAVWVFLLREVPLRYLVPQLTNLPRVLDPGNAGPAVFGVAALAILVFLLVFGLVGGWFLAGRMLAPLARITAATRAAADGSLSHRIALADRHDEFRELADAFDTMLARLAAHVAEQRRFAANASHELRTPLAITRTLLDVARADPTHDPLLDRLHTVNTRAIALTEALLLVGRAEAGSFAREPVDLSLLAEEAVETLLPLAEERGVSLEVLADPALAVGSPALLQQVTTNLVHNAIVHNVPGGTVWITVAEDLVVENTGPPVALVAGLTEPFRRGDERLGGDGVGLGLAIVRSIVDAHDGTLALTPRPGGGLRAVVSLGAISTSADRP
jgi:two-component system, OmpR family, sensor histidine kinase VanS